MPIDLKAWLFRSNSFCFCIPVRAGFVLMSILTFLLSGTVSTIIWFELSHSYQLSSEERVAFFLTGIVESLLFLASIVGFIGAVARKQLFAMIYTYFLYIHFVLNLIVGIYFLVTVRASNRQELVDDCAKVLGGTSMESSCAQLMSVSTYVFIAIVAALLLLESYGALIATRYVYRLRTQKRDDRSRRLGYFHALSTPETRSSRHRREASDNVELLHSRESTGDLRDPEDDVILDIRPPSYMPVPMHDRDLPPVPAPSSSLSPILRELRELLEKDITERVVGSGLRKLVAEEKAKAVAESKGKEGVGVGGVVDGEVKPAEKKGWKGLSFRKPGKRVREEEVKNVVVPLVEEVCLEEMEPEPEPELKPEPEPEPLVSPPKKKRKKEVVPKERSVEVESEVEDDVGLDARKRVLSEDMEVEEPVKKKAKNGVVEEEEVPIKKALSKKKSLKKKPVKDVVEEVILSDSLTFVPPTTTTIDVSKLELESISRSLSPVPQELPPPIQPPDLFEEGVCEDDEDLYFTRLVLSGETEPLRAPSPPPDAVPPFRKHVTGSARTEGYYKISHAEKSAYVAQYTLRSTNIEDAAPTEKPPVQHVTSSRSNRANARRRAQGLEEINQVQRAVALSKGETGAAELSIKFNQLQTRKKHLRFARSPIHDWGLYAMERIARGEMVIEYVGEIIRAQVADKREKVYERQGIGSSYLFRIDEDLVVDATKKGNLGRLINHSCDPNCTAKIITISGEKKIVIYAKQDIELGDEITYDYHFPIEQDKIPCLCGSAKCRGYLN